MFRLLPLIFRNVLRNRRRTLLTLVSTVISLAVLTLMMGLYYGVFLETASSPAAATRIITRHKVSLIQTLPLNYAARIRGLDGVVAATASSWYGGIYKEPKNFFPNFAIEPEHFFNYVTDFKISPEQIAAFQAQRTGAVASEALVKRFGWKLGERVTLRSDIYRNALEFTVVGIFQTTDDPGSELFYFDRRYLAETLRSVGDTDADRIGTVGARLRSEADVPLVARAIDELFANSPAPTRTESEKEFLRGFVALIGNVRLVLGTLVGAVTFTLLLVSANTIAMSVRERTREIAIIRTLGYTPGEIAALVIGESAILSAVGGAAGVALGAVLAEGSKAFLRGFGYRGLSWEPTVAAVVLAVFIGVAASFVPAVLASRKDLVPSLRFAG